MAAYQLQNNYVASEKHIVSEAAEVLEELLNAVENGLDTLPEREKVKFTKDIWNKAKEEKQYKELQERAEEK